MERLPSFRGSAFGNSRESCKSDRPALRGIGRTVLPRRFPPVPLDGNGRGEEAWTRPGRRRAISHGPTDRKSTRLNPVTNAHHVCRLLLAKKKSFLYKT